MLIDQRLAPLCLPPPPTATGWRGISTPPPPYHVTRRDGTSVALPSPLFWYAPDWYQLEADLADLLAFALSQRSVAVAALRSELGAPGRKPLLFADADRQQPADGTGGAAAPPARVVPYRPERYGLSVQDFDGAAVVDVRLTLARDTSGRFAFPPAQLARWEATPDDQPLSGGSWVPASSFPPDVVSLEHLAVKLAQLRTLAPSAALFVSLWPYRLSQELPQLLAAEPDGILLRADRVALEGLQLAHLVRRARQLLKRSGQSQMPLWVAPGRVTADDAAKLIALGASAVAVDSWCERVRDRAVASRISSTGARLGYAKAESDSPESLLKMVDREIGDSLERFHGLYQTLSQVADEQRLGSFDPRWSKALGVPALG